MSSIKTPDEEFVVVNCQVNVVPSGNPSAEYGVKLNVSVTFARAYVVPLLFAATWLVGAVTVTVKSGITGAFVTFT